MLDENITLDGMLDEIITLDGMLHDAMLDEYILLGGQSDRKIQCEIKCVDRLGDAFEIR